MVLGKKKFLVFGATGRTGEEIVKDLTSRGHEVTICVRNIQKAKKLFNDINNLKIVEFQNLDQLKLLINDEKADYIVSSVAFNSHDFSTFYNDQFFFNAKIIQAAKESGHDAVFIFISSLGIERPTMYMSRFIENIRPNALFYKNMIEILIRTSGMKYIIVRPGKLEENNNKIHNINIGQGDKLAGMISFTTVAYVLSVLIHNETQILNITVDAAASKPMLSMPVSKEGLVDKMNNLRPDNDKPNLIHNHSSPAKYFFSTNLPLKLILAGLTMKLISFGIRRSRKINFIKKYLFKN
jgi:putative NADH-flavin reductase